jgi:hypothetical protein
VSCRGVNELQEVNELQGELQTELQAELQGVKLTALSFSGLMAVVAKAAASGMVYTYIHTNIYIYIYTYTCVCVYICIHIYIYIHTYIHVCIYMSYICIHRFCLASAARSGVGGDARAQDQSRCRHLREPNGGAGKADEQGRGIDKRRCGFIAGDAQ